MPAIALPLAPVVAPGLAQAATLAAGTAAYVAQQLYGFRAPLPPLPRTQGRAGQGTLGELVADAIAGARVGVASLPNPLGPEGSLGGLGLAALGGILRQLAQQWGQRNGPPRGGSGSVPTSGFDAAGLTYSGNIGRLGYSTTITYNLRFAYMGGTKCDQYALGGGVAWTVTYSGGIQGLTTVVEGNNSCNQVKTKRFGVVLPNGGFQQLVAMSSGQALILDPVGSLSFSTTDPLGVSAVTALTSPRPWLGAPAETPDPPAQSAMPATPAPAAPLPAAAAPAGIGGETVAAGAVPSTPAPMAPVPTPAYLPAAVPWTPAGSPGTGSGGQALPAAVPGGFPTYNPSQPTQQTNPDGTVAPVAPAPTPTTDAGSVIPWPGAAPIPGTGVAPAATLTGIAQEVGRIERKLEVMNTPGEPGNMVDKFGDLSQLVGPLIEAIMALSSGTTYTLDSPCEVDDEGNKLPPVVVEAPGALTSFGAIVNRIDALAQLLQVHKDLKQPGCKHRPTGEWVTVQFEETTDVG